MASGTILFEYVMGDLAKLELVKHSWFCCIAVKKAIYRFKPTDTWYVCLGAVKWCALSWHCSVLTSGAFKYVKVSMPKNKDGSFDFTPGEAVRPMFWFANQSDENIDWEAYPILEYAVPGSSSPAQLENQGILLRVATNPVNPVKYALQQRQRILAPDLRNLCLRPTPSLTVSKLMGQKTLNMRSYCMALLLHYLPEETDETKESIVQDICGPQKPSKDDSDELSKFMDPENAKYFKRSDALQGHKEKLEKAAARAEMEGPWGRTPEELKSLLPTDADGKRLGGVSWQPSSSTFSAWYNAVAVGNQESTMRTYDGPQADRTMFDALKLVLKFVYVSHFSSGFEALQNMPSDPMIKKALDVALAKNPLAAKGVKAAAAVGKAAAKSSSAASSSASGSAASSAASSVTPKLSGAPAAKAKSAAPKSGAVKPGAPKSATKKGKKS